MHALFFAGLLSYFIPAPDTPRMEMPAWPEAKRQPVRVEKSAKLDLRGKIHRAGTMPKKVREYGTPALHVFADKTRIRNFAWRGSMEGLHVGTQEFNAKGMRRKHKPISVILEKLFCDDIGEDCVSIQPRAKVTMRECRFQGNFGIKKGEGDDPGQDKIVQIDGAEVLIENCDFFNGLTAIKGKANSTIRVRNCRFIRCSTCVSGDGVDNPRPGEQYDNGRAGPCKIIVENCICWDCKEVARAFKGCEIVLKNVKIYRTWRMGRESGGTVKD